MMKHPESVENNDNNLVCAQYRDTVAPGHVDRTQTAQMQVKPFVLLHQKRLPPTCIFNMLRNRKQHTAVHVQVNVVITVIFEGHGDYYVLFLL